MKKPEFTCPKKEDIEETLKEFQDTSVAFTEIDSCVERLKASYKLQYDYYVDEIMGKLEAYKESCENLRQYCEYLEVIDRERIHSIQRLLEGIKYYASPKNWEIPEVDSRGFGGMSSRSIIELEDYDATIFSSGKLAREILEGKGIKQYLKNV